MEMRCGTLLLCLLLAGCANLWQQHYLGSEAPDAPVRLRAVPLSELIAAGPQPSVPAALRAQLRDAPADARVDVLGVSEVVAASRRPPRLGQLKAFARKLGADFMVVTTAYAGQTTEVVGFPRADSVPGGEGVTASAARARVVSIDPEVVLEDRYLHRAVFLRWSSPNEPLHPAPRDDD